MKKLALLLLCLIANSSCLYMTIVSPEQYHVLTPEVNEDSYFYLLTENFFSTAKVYLYFRDQRSHFKYNELEICYTDENPKSKTAVSNCRFRWINYYRATTDKNGDKYYYSFEENDSFNIVMEYGGDTNLKQFIHAHKAKANLIGEKLIENIIIQICLGLKEIHDNNIIHRDLTPDNIFIDENNKIKIGDFGISKILTASNKYANSTVGKYKYFAPELVKGEKHNNKIDIYSLGCIIYELFTLSEYYVDTKIDGKEGKINLEIYNKKWQELIDLLLINDYHKRPNIGEILFKLINNEIKITVYVRENEINKKIYFLKNNENPENNHLVEYYKNKNVKTQEMDETNTELYIDEIKHNFRNYREFEFIFFQY